MCQVRVGRQSEASLSALAGGGKVEGSKSDQAFDVDGGLAVMSAAGDLLMCVVSDPLVFVA